VADNPDRVVWSGQSSRPACSVITPHPGLRGWVTAELGLDDVCRDSLDEVLRVATTLKSDLFVGLASWKLAILTSYRGDADTTLELIRTFELHRAGWWSSGSGDFLAEAADLLDLVGHFALAREYLERVTCEPRTWPTSLRCQPPRSSHATETRPTRSASSTVPRRCASIQGSAGG
jgi:hypothetical protein